MIHLYLNNKRLMQQNGNEHCNQKKIHQLVLEDLLKQLMVVIKLVI